MPRARATAGRGAGGGPPAGRGVSGRAVPPPLGPIATRRRNSGPGALSSPSSLALAGVGYTPCRSRSATGSKVGACCPALSRARRPPVVTCARGAARAGTRRGRVAREVASLPRCLFVSRRREGVRLAQSSAGEAAGGDQPGKPRHRGRQRTGSLRPTVPLHPLQTKISPFLPHPWPSPVAFLPPAVWPRLQVSPLHPLALCLAVSGCK